MSETSSQRKDEEDTERVNRILDTDGIIQRIGQVTDRFGNVVYFGNAGEFWLPPILDKPKFDYRKSIRSTRDLEIRPDDVLLCSFPKTGIHWNREIIKMLLKKTSTYPKEDSIFENFIDFDPPAIERMPSPRLLMTHAPFRYLPRQAFQKKIKIICLERNPKDTFVSLYNHTQKMAIPMSYPGTFQQFFSFYFECGYYFGDLFDYLMERQEGLEANPDVEVFVSVFEEMKRDPVNGMKKLNDYLGTGCSDELCEEIALACSFKEMKSFKEKNSDDLEASNFKTGKTQIYRKGEVGDWKNWFTVAMNEEFDAEYNKRMSNYKRTYTYTL